MRVAFALSGLCAAALGALVVPSPAITQQTTSPVAESSVDAAKPPTEPSTSATPDSTKTDEATAAPGDSTAIPAEASEGSDAKTKAEEKISAAVDDKARDNGATNEESAGAPRPTKKKAAKTSKKKSGSSASGKARAPPRGSH